MKSKAIIKVHCNAMDGNKIRRVYGKGSEAFKQWKQQCRSLFKKSR